MRSLTALAVAVAAIALSACRGEGVEVDTNPDAAVPPANSIDIVEPVLGEATGSPAEVGRWGDILDWPLVAVSMANLPDGRILTYSGSERRTWPTTERTFSAVWNPETGSFTENLHQGHNMFCAAMSMTDDGRVLVNGGRNAGNSPWTSVFDYRDSQWQTIENMASGGRWYPSTLTMGDGRIMTAMGSSTNVRNPDVWDPDQGWSVLNGIDFLSMRTRNNQRGRENVFPLLSLAPNGNVYHYWDTTENHMINPAGTGRVRVADADDDGVNHAGGVQVVYDAGKLLISGRNDGNWGGNSTGAAANAFTVDLNGAAPVIRSTADMLHPRKFHQMIPLPTGEVLVVGGNTTGAKFQDNGSVMEPEIWNPDTGQWRPMANMGVPRDYHSTALLLTDGRVLTAGGGYAPSNPNSGGTHQDAQIFSPPYLFNSDGSLATRPTVSADFPSADVGAALAVNTSDDIAYFSLIKLSATTHAINTDVRHYRPDFSQIAANTFEVTINQNPNVSVPGYWMLFAVNTDGVPSEAQVIRVTAVDTRLDNIALLGTATQSSTYQSALDLEAGNAIDGDLSGADVTGSLSHTRTEAQAWWELDLGRVMEIDTIRLWNRTDCCAARLSDFNVLVSSVPFASQALGVTQAQTGVTDFPVDGTAGRQTDITVNNPGRYIRVQLRGTNALQLAEVQVFGSRRADISNVAPDGSATQSSLWRSDYPASIAIDGITESNGVNGQNITHTRADANAWWELDLGRVVDIDSVVLWNRTDCCSSRLSDFYVFTSAVPFSSKDLNTTRGQADVATRFISGQAADTEEIPVGAQGRYVRVQLASNSQFLSLTEVQVMGAALRVPLSAQPLAQQPQATGNMLTLTAQAQGSGTLQYKWNFGDGTPETAFSGSPDISHRYNNAGRYVVTLTVRDSSGDEVRQTYTQVVHEPLNAAMAKSSTSLVEHSTRAQLWNVNPDNNSVSVIDTSTLALLAEIQVGRNPVALAEAPNGDIWVTNRADASVSVISAASLAATETIDLPKASQPYGIVFNNSTAFIALEAIGRVVQLSADGSELAQADVGASPRHLTIDGAQQFLYVSRFITPPLPGEDTADVIVDDGVRKYGGEVVVLRSSDLNITDTIILEHSNRIVSEHQGPGVPNYVGAVVIAPSGNAGWVPSKQDNILAGALRGGAGMTFDQTVRAVTSKIDLNNNTEQLGSRVDHDNASVAGASVFDPYGVTLFTSLEGNRQVALIDVSTDIEIGRIDTGRAPQGLAVSGDGSRLYVHNFMDRTVGVYDIGAVVNNGATEAPDIATVNVVSSEALDATVLRGKQLFYDARDDRLAGLDYMSCASCHADGEHDGRVWDFTSVGEGLRNTITLRGRAGMGHGMLHWSSNFDEVQDFEGQIREFAGGTGLMNDADFANTSEPLGNPKAGLSSDLDALTAYMTSLDRVDDSPWRLADGSMTAAALSGESVFATQGCATCHEGLIFTDSNDAVLHDIGTIMPESGNRLSGVLTGIDTPTLLGVWGTGPYLHDGSAPTLEDAVTAHLNVTLTPGELNDLSEYLAQIDNSTVAAPTLPPPTVEPPSNASVSNPIADNALTIDGALSDWESLTGFGNDAADATGADSVDWLEVLVAHDATHYYIGYRTVEDITDSWGYGMYIDVDGNTATGFRGFGGELPIGADYVLEGGTLLEYTGSGTNWSWDEIAFIDVARRGNSAEAVIPMSLLGGANVLRFYMHGNSGALGGSGIDHYPDKVADPSAEDAERFFVYSTAASNGNTPPAALAQQVSVAINASVQIVLNGSDIDGDALTYEIADQPVNGALTGTPPALSYVPAADFVGTDLFTFTVSDGDATSIAASVTVNVVGETPNNTANITVDGELNDWNGVDSFGLDPLDANGLNDSIDWVQAWVAHNDQNLYFAYENETQTTLSWGYGIYIDTDGNSATGFRGFVGEYPIGADYLIEGSDVQKYTGGGSNWSWTSVATADIGLAGNTAELAVSRAVLGDPQALELFYLGQNAAVGGPTSDFYPDNAATANAPVRNFSYALSESVNASPIASDMVLTTTRGTALNVVLTGSDPEGSALTFEVTLQPSNGSLSGNPPNLVYTPDGNFTGAESFAYRVSDGTSVSAPATVSIVVTDPSASASELSNPVSDILIDGNLEDWNGVAAFAADPADVADAAGQIDWRQGWMAHNADSLFIAYQNDGPISALSYGYAAYLDTDARVSTGFTGFIGEFTTGADYLLEGRDLYRYTGSGTDWSWEYLGSVTANFVGGVAEVELPRALLGNPSTIDFYWRGDNGAVNADAVDFYPDAADDPNAAAVDRRFRYTM
jgi:YVTN family beta-propeller protein